MNNPLAPYYKAVLACVIAFAGAGATAAADGAITGPEWWTIALATVVALGAVYGVPNRPQGPTV